MDRQLRTGRVTASFAAFLATAGLVCAAAVAVTIPTATTAGAQATEARHGATIVRVHVTDSTGAPLAQADVSLMHGLKTVVATGRTDDAGNREFVVDLDSTDYSVVARKIGFVRGDHFFSVRQPLVGLAVTMRRAEAALPTVTVSATNAQFKSYNIDADQIAAADVPVHSALDVVERLRPDMIISRSGAFGGHAHYGCPPMTNVWVNDERYPGAFVTPGADVWMRAHGPGNRIARIGLGNMETLNEIAPEFIATMHYRDCFDGTERRIGTTNALFIVLKPGVAYNAGRGAYVLDERPTVATTRKP